MIVYRVVSVTGRIGPDYDSHDAAWSAWHALGSPEGAWIVSAKSERQAP